MNKKVFYRKDYLTFKKKYSLLCNAEPISLICLEKPNISSTFVKRITITEIKKYGD
mgnify:CR=1 FL=1|jgi:hypothetical protein